MDKQYDFLIFILRGQPFHNGHKKVIDEALERAHHVIVLIGSSFEARSYRNPFLYGERHDMIYCSYGKELERLSIRPLIDILYVNNAWLENTQKVVHEAVNAVVKQKGNQGFEWASQILNGIFKPRIGLIGHSKDHTGFYLNLFPQWGSVNVPGYDDQKLLDATWIRNLYFTERDNSQLMSMVLPSIVPLGTMDFLENFYQSPEYDWVWGEHEYCENYKAPYKGLKHPVSFQTVDAVVVQSGHVLMIERKGRPGKGLLALPGGFINPAEQIKAAMIRELIEETQLKVVDRVIEGSIKKFWVFDDPHRDPRGRVFSNTFLISLEPKPKLPRVKGGDDAKKAFWVELSELDRTLCFNDHFHIVNKMTAGV